MGNCVASQTKVPRLRHPDAAKVIHVDGRLQEFRQPIKAGHVIAQNPNCFLCSSESIDVGSHAPHVADDEVLQLGQIYFLMPLSNSQIALSLPDLCALAIKASVALRKEGYAPTHGVRFPARSRHGCKIPVPICNGDNRGIKCRNL